MIKRSIIKFTGFKAADGTIFDTETEAEQYQRSLDVAVELRSLVDRVVADVENQRMVMEFLMENSAEIWETIAPPKANDALVSAAPDLLEACKMIDGWHNGGSLSVFRLESMLLKLRAAIAKAEGRTP